MNINVTFSENQQNIPVSMAGDDGISISTQFQNTVMIPAETDHAKLKNREAADQHPISAITGLRAELDSALSDSEALTNIEIEEILRGFV